MWTYVCCWWTCKGSTAWLLSATGTSVWQLSACPVQQHSPDPAPVCPAYDTGTAQHNISCLDLSSLVPSVLMGIMTWPNLRNQA